MSGAARGSDGEGQGTSRDEPGSEAASEPQAEPERVNLFTVSALRLHMPRGGMPPTPGTEPSLVQRLTRRVRRTGAGLLQIVRGRLGRR